MVGIFKKKKHLNKDGIGIIDAGVIDTVYRYSEQIYFFFRATGFTYTFFFSRHIGNLCTSTFWNRASRLNGVAIR